MLKLWLLINTICLTGVLYIPINAEIIDPGNTSKSNSLAEEKQNDRLLKEQEYIDKALHYIEQDKSFYYVDDLKNQLMFDEFRNNERGIKVSFYQHVDGVPVVGGYLAVFFDRDGEFHEIRGRILSHAQDFDTSGSITEEQALQIIKDDLSSKGSEIVRTYFCDLVVYDENSCYRDVWIITVVQSDYELGDCQYTIDAETGDILKIEFYNRGIRSRVYCNPEVEMAYHYALDNKEALGLTKPAEELIIRQVSSSSVEFNTEYDDIPIKSNRIQISFDFSGNINGASGKIDPQIKQINTTPTISEEIATKTAEGHYREIHALAPQSSDITTKDIKLGIWKTKDKVYKLIWEIYVGKAGHSGSRHYFIDAHTNEILHEFSPR